MLEGQELSNEDRFYLNWAMDTVKLNISLANDILKQLITLSTALLGISLIFESIVSSEGLKIIVLFSFFFCLIVSLLGLLPYEREVDISSPSDIKEHKINALKHKRMYLWIASGFLLLGFVIILGELVVMWFELA